VINNHKYYKNLETEDLVELLANVTDKYTCAQAIGVVERTLESYRELIELLHNEIELRATAKPGYTPPGIRSSPINT